jgi:hypothetical protein
MLGGRGGGWREDLREIRQPLASLIGAETARRGHDNSDGRMTGGDYCGRNHF